MTLLADIDIRESLAPETPPDDGAAWVLALLDAHAAAAGHPWQSTSIRLEAWQGARRIGGLDGYAVYDWMHVRLVAVDADRRGLGVGSALLARAERIAEQLDKLGVTLETMGFQAPGFYRRLDYAEIARLPGRTAAKDRIMLAKRLDGVAP